MTPLDHFKAFLQAIGYTGEPKDDTMGLVANAVRYEMNEESIPAPYDGYIGFGYDFWFDKTTGELVAHGGFE